MASNSAADAPLTQNLFPLRPTSDDVDSVEYLFSSAADGSDTTLTSIFGDVSSSSTSSSSTSEENRDKNNHDGSSGRDHHHDLLARTALRKKERDRCREERWVCYSEVMSNCWPGGGGSPVMVTKKKKKQRRRRLALKLDYEDIINSWGRPLIHIELESPAATVPELPNLDHYLLHQSTFAGGEVATGGWEFCEQASLWRVPDAGKRWNHININHDHPHHHAKTKEEAAAAAVENGREASMMRYKEKRQSRLFSKRVRYHVRKINAEKRPRIKGRFVKTS